MFGRETIATIVRKQVMEKIKYLTLYKDVWIDAEEYRDILSNDLCEESEYVSLSDKEYYKMIDEKVAGTEFCKAIVIYVG